MKRKLSVIFILILFLSFSFYCKKKVAPSREDIGSMLKLLPRNAIGMVFLNVQKISHTEFFEKSITKEQEKPGKYQQFIKDWGIDPKKDVYYIAIAVTGEEAIEKKPEAVAIARLNYSKDLIINNLKKEGFEIQEVKYEGMTIYGGIDKKNKKTKMVFLDKDHIVVGSEGSLKSIIDLYKGKGENIYKNAKLMDLMKDINQASFLWGCFLIPEKALKKATTKNPQAKIFESIESSSFFIDYENKKYSGQLNLFSSDETKNKQIVDFLNGIKAMIGMGKAQDPDFQELLENIKISAGPTGINFTVELAEDLLMRLREKSKKEK
jgi:hypothetical protein